MLARAERADREDVLPPGAIASVGMQWMWGVQGMGVFCGGLCKGAGGRAWGGTSLHAAPAA
eukprot:7968167-Prorocentrum_lima.AAC.1